LQLAPKYLLVNAEHDGEKYAASLGAASLEDLRRLPASLLTGNAGGIVHFVYTTNLGSVAAKPTYHYCSRLFILFIYRGDD
jgi:hypothetical protein